MTWPLAFWRRKAPLLLQRLGGEAAGFWKGFPWWRYVRNSAYYHFFRKAPSITQLHQTSSFWEVPSSGCDGVGVSPGQLYESAELHSVWLIRQCLQEASRQRILTLIRHLADWEDAAGWYDYELGRFMLPLHADPPLDDGSPNSPGLHLVEGLDVFGDRGGVQQWPKLSELRHCGVEGAEEMYQLQQLMPTRLPSAFAAGHRCLFIQLQLLEMGAEVTPHRDALPYGGDRIATVVLQGSSEVRVGHQTFRVEEGDCYALAHDARYLVEHEVKAASEDRISVTFRYGVSPWISLPKLQGEELRQADRGGPALWES